MTNKTIIYLLLLVPSLIGCTSNAESVDEQLNTGKTRYTFSQSKEVNFHVSSGSYQILYDFSMPIDTLFGYSGAHLIGRDSIVYLQVRKDIDYSGDIDLGHEGYSGDLIGLKMYDGKKIISLKLPKYTPMFSSFSVNKDVLYYWGCSEDLFACSYNFKTKEFQKQRLQNGAIGTDFYGAFDPPIFDENDHVIFNCYGNGKSWTLTSNLSKTVKFEEVSGRIH